MPPVSDPAMLNGDIELSPAQTKAYIEFHARRNERNARRTVALGIDTAPSPVWGLSVVGGASPARILLDAYYDTLARRWAPRYHGRDVVIADLGCGAGGRIEPFARAGYSGRYIGIDIVRSPRWPARAVGALEPVLIIADAHTLDPLSLPPIDILISTTALEHLRDDREVIARLSRRIAPGGVQAHFVPAEAALDIYGRHGWRQYSPACLRDLLPRCVMTRFGGPFSSLLHAHAIYEPSRLGRPTMPARRPRVYPWLRAAALAADRIIGCPRPTMYAAVQDEPIGGDLARVPTAFTQPMRRAG